MKSSRRPQLLIRFGLLVGLVAIGGWAATKVDWGLVLRQLRAADLRLELFMAGAWILALFIRPVRIMILAYALAPDVRPKYAPIWSADVVAMAMNSIIPMRAGDIMMTVILGQGLGITTARSTSIVLVDRFFDFATVVVVFATALTLVPTAIPWAHQVIVGLVPAMVVLMLGLWFAVHFRRFWLDLLERLLRRMTAERRDRWLHLARDLFGGFAKIDNLRILILVVGLSAVQWAVISGSYWFGLSAVFPSAPFVGAAFAAAVVALSFIVPIAPGGFGVFHGAAVLALSIFGVPAEPALAFAIVAHAFQMGSVVLLGALALIWQGVGLRTLAAIRNSQS